MTKAKEKKPIDLGTTMIDWEREDGTIVTTNSLAANVAKAMELGWKMVK